MLELVDDGVLALVGMIGLKSHSPGTIFGVRDRGFLREGYRADTTIVSPRCPWMVTKDVIESRCGWSPMEGHTYNWRVERTICNGHTVFNNGMVDRNYIGMAIDFR